MLAVLVTAASAANQQGRPLWIGPPMSENGAHLRALLAHPEQWSETRSQISGVLLADHALHRSFTDDELGGLFANLHAWHLSFALETGAVKEWAATGHEAFAKERPMWERFIRLGATIDVFALDEPLTFVRKAGKTDDFAVQQTADFIAQVRSNFPAARIGDIEAYPFIPLAEQIRWIDALQAELKARNVRGLDFYRLDPNWPEFTVFNRGNWQEVRTLERACRERKLPFSLIYWAADYSAMKKRGIADDSTWYVSLLRQGYDYALIDGRPDEQIVESWIGAPTNMLPESGEFTFTRSVRDFAGRFADPKQ